MISEPDPGFLERCLEIIQASQDAARCAELATKLCAELDIERIDFSNPLTCSIETALSRGFLAAYCNEDYRLALRLSEVATAIASRIPDYALGHARTENNQALALMELGDFVSARRLFEQALERLERVQDPLNLKGTIVSNLAAMESMRSNDDSFTRGLLFTRSWHGRNQLGLQAIAHGEFARALQLFESVLTNADLDARSRATVLSNLASAQTHLGQMTEARANLESAIELCGANGYRGQVLAGLLYTYAELLLRDGGLEEYGSKIEFSLKRAWDIIRPVVPHSRQTLLVLRSLARLRMAQRDLVRARAILDRGIGLYEEMRVGSGRDEVELSGLFVIFRLLIELRLWVALEDETPAEAALLTQRAKARFWYDAMRTRGPALAERDELTTSVESAREFGALLGAHGTLLEFFVGPNATFVLVVHNRTMAAYRVDITEEELYRQIHRIRTDLSSGFSGGQGISNLSALLLRNAGFQWLSNRIIVIAPDGPLWLLPMTLLEVPTCQRMLAQTAPCFFVPSSAVLQRIRSRPTSHRFARALVVAHEGRKDLLERLTNAGDETDFVRSAFQSNGTTRVLGTLPNAVGPATRENVLRELPVATHVHILAHAIGGDSERESRIVLAGLEAADDFLGASQIESLGLDAELVVLAACESSLGWASPGEGLASLARAFLLAGARCVVATLWEVRDEAIREFFRGFYAALSTGQSPARAYAAARESYEAKFGRDDTANAVILLGDGDIEQDRVFLPVGSQH